MYPGGIWLFHSFFVTLDWVFVDSSRLGRKQTFSWKNNFNVMCLLSHQSFKMDHLNDFITSGWWTACAVPWLTIGFYLLTFLDLSSFCDCNHLFFQLTKSLCASYFRLSSSFIRCNKCFFVVNCQYQSMSNKQDCIATHIHSRSQIDLIVSSFSHHNWLSRCSMPNDLLCDANLSENTHRKCCNCCEHKSYFCERVVLIRQEFRLDSFPVCPCVGYVPNKNRPFTFGDQWHGWEIGRNVNFLHNETTPEM